MKANNQQDINSATVKKGNTEQATLKSALLKYHTIENFINKRYTHISTMAGHSNN